MDQRKIGESLQAKGHRLTPQRMAILEYLLDSTDHPSAQDIYTALRARYPSLSLATVYNTLALLIDDGMIREIKIGGDGVRYDANPQPHVNLYCRSCERIFDLPLHSLAGLEEDIRNRSGFAAKSITCEVSGLCNKCQNGGKNA